MSSAIRWKEGMHISVSASANELENTSISDIEKSIIVRRYLSAWYDITASGDELNQNLSDTTVSKI